MKHLLNKKFGFIFLTLLIFAGCSDEISIPSGLSNLSKVSSWSQLNYSANAPSFTARSNSLASYNDSIIYIIGSGNLGSFTNTEVWQFLPKEQKLTKLARQTPFNAVGSISFVLNGKLHFGLGVNASGFQNLIYYAYSSTNWGGNTFLGAARSHAISFVIGDKAYVGLGTNGSTYFQDFYEFDGINWTKIANFPGPGRQDACVFVINSKAYIGTGYNGSGYFKDFWELDPLKNKWRQISDMPGIQRDDAVAFAFEKRGYVGTGWNNYQGVLSDFWEYNPQTDVWKSAPAFESTGRLGAVAFTNGGKAYVGTGNSSIDLKDFWISK